MPEDYEKVGSLVKRGILLFSGLSPIPAASLISAVAAALISKALMVYRQRLTEALSEELSLTHISYAEPDDDDLLAFYSRNPAYPELALSFQNEIQNEDYATLRRHHPYLYAALILKREIPELLFHQEIKKGEFRKLAEEYETLSHGFATIQGTVELKNQINRFAGELLQVIDGVYDAVKDEMKTKDNQLAFDLIDYVREVAGL